MTRNSVMGSEVPAAGAVTSAPVIAGDKLYFGAEDGSVYCVNKDTGEEIEKKKKVKGACRGIVPYGDGIIAYADRHPGGLRRKERACKGRHAEDPEPF